MIGIHLIFGAYGFWLPNDPRGSGSDFIRSFELWCHGPATRVTTRRSVAAVEHNAIAREAAKKSLRYPPVQFTGEQAQTIGMGFADYVRRSSTTIWACSMLPDHVHLVLGPLKIDADRAIGQFKGAATRELVARRLHPFTAFAVPGDAPPSCWARKGWKVFLDDEEDVLRTIRYVEDNPIKEGKPRQKWSFVLPYPRVSGSPQESGDSIRPVATGPSPRSPSESR